MNNVQLKKICRELNEFAQGDGYNTPKCIRVEFTSFQPVHKAVRGRNGVGELVELQTQVIEADAIHVEQWAKSSLLTVYVKAVTASFHGFGPKSGTYLRVRDAKGKYQSIEVYPKWERDEVEIGRLQSLFGYESAAGFDLQGFKEFCEREGEKVLRLACPAGEIEDDAAFQPANHKHMARAFTDLFYRELINYELKEGRTEEFDKFLAYMGAKLVSIFVFTDRFWGVSPQYLDVNAKGFEVGWTSNNTYNSLPNTLKVFKAKGIKTVKLAALGIEGSGYYSHSDQMRILPEQAKEAERFNKRFELKKRTITEQVVSQALKAS